jgi:hypothetical protein
LGAKLDQPQNFWGLKNFPEDWTVAFPSALSKVPQLAAPAQTSVQVTGVQNELSDANPQFTKEDVKKIIVDVVRPLHAEIAVVKEKLVRAEANRSRFDVSLSSIPPELEQQLAQRLRQELGPKVIEEARQQSVRLLTATKEAIEELVGEVQEEFQRESKKELGIVEQRAGQIAARIVESIREQLRDGVGDMQRRLSDARNQLVRVSDELSVSLQTSLNNEDSARREQLEQLRVEVAAESLRLHEQIEQLDSRTRSLDESVRSWESSLDESLNRMASETMNRTRNELEGVADNMLNDVTARSAETIGNQMEEAAGNMRTFHQGIVASGSDALKAKTAHALQDFEHSTEEMIQLSVERCRQRLASGFDFVVKKLGEQFQ